MAKIILATQNEELFHEVSELIFTKNKSILDLPEQDIQISLHEIEVGLGILHQDAMSNFNKWL